MKGVKNRKDHLDNLAGERRGAILLLPLIYPVS